MLKVPGMFAQLVAIICIIVCMIIIFFVWKLYRKDQRSIREKAVEDEEDLRF
jgi:heme/copper-type cytochrome/quinol oxidase subunit 2